MSSMLSQRPASNRPMIPTIVGSKKLFCPKCGRQLDRLPNPADARFMYRTVMQSKEGAVFCKDCGYDLTEKVKEWWAEAYPFTVLKEAEK